jgi:hypothetical protein
MQLLNTKDVPLRTLIWRYTPLNKVSQQYQIWIKGTSSPEITREKAKHDPHFQRRLLEYIDQVACETMPEEVDDDSNARLGHWVFQPFVDPDDPDFNHLIRLDLSDIIRARQMHLRQHMPTCFKYK